MVDFTFDDMNKLISKIYDEIDLLQEAMPTLKRGEPQRYVQGKIDGLQLAACKIRANFDGIL